MKSFVKQMLQNSRLKPSSDGYCLRLCILFLFFTSLFFSTISQAQQSILTAGVAVTQNFDGMGTGLAIPAPFKINVTTSVTDYANAANVTAVTKVAGITGINAFTGTSTGAAYNMANGDSATATDRAVGFLNTASYASSRSIMYAFTNNTGVTVTSLSIAWDYEKYRSGSRAWSWTFFHGPTSASLIASTAGDLAYPADLNNTTIPNPVLVTPKSVSITGLSIANGTTYYLRWTLTTSNLPTAGSSNGQALAIDNVSLTLTGSAPATPTVNIVSANPAVAAASIQQGSINNLLYSSTVTVSNAAVTLNSVTCTPAGTYIPTTDVTNLKLWYSPLSTFNAATAVLVGNVTPPASGVGQTYTPPIGVPMPVGTYYFYVTADIPCTATIGKTMSINAPVAANFSFASSIVPTVAAFASGVQTISAALPNAVVGAYANGGNAQITTGWSSIAGCYDEVMIVATDAASVVATPTGNGSAYTANLNYGAGTLVGNAYCVYKGTTSPVTFSNLINGTLYNIAIYVRKGTVWSSAALCSATPSFAIEGDYRSKVSGNWTTIATWEKFVSGAWIAAPDAPSSTTTTVTILNTHTIVYNASLQTVKNLNVNAGGKLWVGNTSNTYLNLYGNIICNGTIGNGATLDGFGINVEGINDTLAGTGSFSTVRLRKLTNANLVTNVVINIDLRLYWVSAAGTAALYNACTTSANQLNVTLNAGKTITTDGNISIDGVAGATGGGDAYGTYTINGTLNVGLLYLTCNNSTFSPNFIIGSAGIVNAVQVSMAQSIGVVPHILTIQTGGKLNITGAAAISPFSAVNNTYNFLAGSTLEYSGSTNQPVESGLPYSNLTISGTGIKTANGNVNVGNIFTLNAALYSMTGFNLNIADIGSIIGNGGNFDAGLAGGTVNFIGNGLFKGTTALGFNNLQINSGVVQDSLNLSTAQNLYLIGGIFNIGANNQFNMFSGGLVSATAGDFATGINGGILNFNGAGSFTGNSNPFNVYTSGSLDFGVGTVTIQNLGSLRINSGGSVINNGPFYANGSTLVYNNGAPSFTAGTEWSTTAATGRGVPYHVQIGLNTVNTTRLILTGNTWRQLNGDLNIGPATGGSGYGLLMSTTNGGDLKIAGNWTRAASAFFTNSNRVVTFLGPTANQTISVLGGGTETFAYITILKPASLSLVLSANPATDVTINGGNGNGNSLLLFNGNLDLNGRALNFNPFNGFVNNIAIEGTPGNLVRNINSTLAGGTFSIFNTAASAQNTTVVRNSVNASLLSFGSNVKVVLGGQTQNGGINFGASLSTINGILQINNLGSVVSNPPTYAVNANLIYNAGGTYKRNTEWSANAGPGYPFHITIQNLTNVTINDDGVGQNGTANRALAGSLTIQAGATATLGDSTENNSLTIGQDLILVGILTMPSSSNTALANVFVGRNWNKSATGIFNHNERAVYMNGAANGSIIAVGGQYFPYLYISKTALANTVSLSSNISIGKALTVQSGTLDLSVGNITLLSNINNTASFGQVGSSADVAYSGAGRFIVERFMPTGTGIGQHGKSWQFLATPTNGGQTIKSAWQEGATIANQNLLPGFGTQITSNNGGNQAGATALGFDVYTSPGPSMKVFNSLGVWDGIANTNIPIYNQKGYMVFVRGNRATTAYNSPATSTILRTTGKLFVPNSNPIPTSIIPSGKFEAIGNPHASAVDFSYFDKTDYPDVDNAFYVWDPLLLGSYGYGGYQLISAVNGDFLPTPGGTANYPTGVRCSTIQSGQAFLMHATGAGGYVRIPDSAKVIGSANTYRVPATATSRSYLRMYLHAGTSTSSPLADGATVAFNAGYSNAYDQNDGLKLLNAGENLGLMRNGKTLAIEARALISRTDTIFLVTSHLRQQAYQLRFAPVNLGEEALQLLLVDNYTHITQRMSNVDSTYFNFEVNADQNSAAASRFYIILTKAITYPSGPVLTAETQAKTIANKTALEPTSLSIFPNPIRNKQIQLHAQQPLEGLYLLKLFNANGQLVKQARCSLQPNTFYFTIDSKDLPTGWYQLTLSKRKDWQYTTAIYIP